ncbi:hypothetical protein SVIO_095720 [Streptomyces violaceusniger]|uniref:Luciferase-like domain-containing protein n=2 Tax=Streptomyces violaceusniger TaxID=68280 RepID=A0A4D4LM35_STRVO|nr:hypothetical protein SVIO_095720 [Streptomyces violaceusniger]
MWAAWDAGDRKAAVAAVPDEAVDAVCVHGSPEECRERLAGYLRAGVTTPVWAVLPIGLDLREAVGALAPSS